MLKDISKPVKEIELVNDSSVHDINCKFHSVLYLLILPFKLVFYNIFNLSSSMDINTKMPFCFGRMH